MQKMKNRNLLTIIGVLIFVSSCSQSTSSTQAGIPNREPEITISPSETWIANELAATVVMTVQPSVVEKDTETPTVSGSQDSVQAGIDTVDINEDDLIIKCLSIAPFNDPGNVTSDGILVLDTKTGFGNEGPGAYQLNMALGTITKMNQPNELIRDFAVSEDRKWLAYHLIANNKDDDGSLIIAYPDGKTLKTLQWNEDWGSIVSWLGNGRLAVSNPVIENSSIIEWPIVVIDPFKEESQYLSPNFPGIYQHPNSTSFDGWGSAVYNATASQVVYLQNEESSREKFNYVLWDIEGDKQLASFEVVADLHAIPRWSPNGNYFAFAPSLLVDDIQRKWPVYELLRIDQSGQLLQLTNLAEYYPWFYISDVSWSPNSRYIAFWFSSWDEKPGLYTNSEQQLAILDISNGKVTNYCLPGDHSAQLAGLRRVPSPLWSPDSKQVVILNQYSEEHSRVILMDIEQENAVQIADDATPMGWMVSTQD